MDNKTNKHSEAGFEDISNLIDYNEFEQIKNFVLEKGDRNTYRNFDNNNPHYNFGSFDIFFGADIGQRNINNDPKISDFNQLTIYDTNSDIRYYHFIIVRFGDLTNKKVRVRAGMEEGKVYLDDVYNIGLGTLKKKLPNYLKKIREEIKTANQIDRPANKD